MTPGDFYLVLVLGFVSSLHCVQMCGPIVLTYSISANPEAARQPLLGLHLAYNAGRTLTYMLLGAIAGVAGGTMGFVGRLAGVQNVAAIVAGATMLIAGLVLFDLMPGRLGSLGGRGFALPARFLRPVGKLISSRSVGGKFALGLLMGFLPCGLVYAALMRALGTATALGGAITLLAFAAGTSVALLAVGLGASAATRKLARWGTTLSAISVMAMGTLLIFRGALAPHVMRCHMLHMTFR
jgi:hypothetical protein